MNEVTTSQVREMYNAMADLHVGVCRLTYDRQYDEFVVYGEGDHLVGRISTHSDDAKHIARELTQLVWMEMAAL